MRHFAYLSQPACDGLFAVPPQPFSRSSGRDVLALALGATLYSPGTRPTLAADARRAARIGATSQVWDLEDAIGHDDVDRAQANVVAQLRQLADEGDPEDLPLLFVRARAPDQLPAVAAVAGPLLTGFVLPKFGPGPSGETWLQALSAAGVLAGRQLYAMPVLEHEDLAFVEARREHLAQVRALLDASRDAVLAVRVGGTDLSGLFGLRRDRETVIWDIAVVRDALADVVNVFARRGDYVVAGPVWEHFPTSDRLFRTRLRATPFQRKSTTRLREVLLHADIDELLREITLDRANGFTGKTVIHPTHVSVVNALSAVHREEYDDALTVLAGRAGGGVVASPAGGKMNETGPHGLWAEQVAARAALFGVLSDPGGVVPLLDAGWRAAQAAYGPPAPVLP